MITTNSLTKNFKSYKKEPGLRGSIKNIFKREYITKPAVEGFDLNIKKGEIVALLGPNGAGKTTLMKMFTGIIVPSSGQVQVMGHEPYKRNKEFRKKIALVMGQKSQLWWDIPAMDSLLLLQKYYEIPKDDFDQKIKKMAALLNVEELLHIHVRKLSLGERMKMELMASLIHSPDVIFLDEPTIGLDLIAQESIRSFIREYHKNNDTTIIITSHYMADVQALCERIVLIIDGKKGYDGTLKSFENILGSEKVVTFVYDTKQDPTDAIWQGLDAKWDNNHQQVDLRLPEKKLREITSQILIQSPVIDFHTEKLPIERVMKVLMENPKILHK
ncbi:MAG: ATP-binding cassette domain-containing protein [Bdellovibrionales bacterium]|nr:ATP-binding cassette domain-containing protein [Bdellovibrionales bacterium]